MACLDDNTLLEYIEGLLSKEANDKVEAHLDKCSICRKVVSRFILATIDKATSQNNSVDFSKEKTPDQDLLEKKTSIPESLNKENTLEFLDLVGQPKKEKEQAVLLAKRSEFSSSSDSFVDQVADSDKSFEPFLSPKTMVDHFKIKRLIGRGGMGEVYLARDTKLGRKVALKIVHKNQTLSQNVIDRFLFEARATAKFNHPNIVAIHAVGEYQKQPYVALEYLEGQTLKDRITEGPLSSMETARIGLSIAEALKEAHSHNILHRDLKPANIIISKDGRLRVLDFGLAKTIQEETATQTLTGKNIPLSDETATLSVVETKGAGFRGTPAYMAPEQWRSEPATWATDIWALGLILHEMATGQRPYHNCPPNELFIWVPSAEPTPTLENAEEIPSELVEIIARCLEKDPNKRPIAKEVVEALEQVLGGRHKKLLVEQSPFRGLLPFAELHSDFFFGREQEVNSFVERLRDETTIAVVGPSGSGKSSFVQAGVIPRLREQNNWTILRLRPGIHPFVNLASRLLSETSTKDSDTKSLSDSHLRISSKIITEDGGTTQTQQHLVDERIRLSHQLYESPQILSLILSRVAEDHKSNVLLFIDQMEEIYTLVEDELLRQRFTEAICHAADDPEEPVRILFTVRDDFLYRLAETGNAQDTLSHLMLLRRPDENMLNAMLTKPLDIIGYCYDDPLLPHEMIEAVKEEQSALPLLQFTARMLWDNRDKEKRLICRSVYKAIGGIAGALAKHADSVLDGLSLSEKILARKLLIRLVTPKKTRQVSSKRHVLDGLDTKAEEVLNRLIRSRLISVQQSQNQEQTEPSLELVHESLIENWKQLKHWIEESREGLAFLSEIRQAAELWEKRNCPKEEVWQGSALQKARSTIEKGSIDIPKIVIEFLEAGTKREKRKNQRNRLSIILSFAILLIVAVVFAAKEQEARKQKELAEIERDNAEKRQAEALREGAKRALLQGDPLEARAKTRASLESQDSSLARELWGQLIQEPLYWKKTLSGSIFSVDFSPDSLTVAVSCSDTSIYLFDTHTRSIRKVLRGHKDQILAVTFSPDGQTLASASWDGEIRLWDAKTGITKNILRAYSGWILSLEFSPDGTILASAGQDGKIFLWDLKSAKVKHVFDCKTHGIFSAAFSPNSQFLAAAGSSQTIQIWDLKTLNEIQTLKGHNEKIRTVLFTPDNKKVVSCSDDKTIRIWDVTSGKTIGIFQGHTQPVWSIALNPKGNILASAGRDKTIRIWDLQTGKQLRVLEGGTHSIRKLVFSTDGNLIASGGDDTNIRIWDAKVASLQGHIFQGHISGIEGLAFSPDQKMVASGGDTTIRLWDVKTGEQSMVIAGHKDTVRSVNFSPSNNLIVSGGSDKNIYVWETASGIQRFELKGHTDTILDVKFSKDEKLIASTGADKTIRLWDTQTGKHLSTLTGHTNTISKIEFSSDNKKLISSGWDKTIRIWDISTKKQISTLTGHTDAVHAASFSPDERQIVSGSWDNTIRLWDFRSKTSSVFAKNLGRVYSVSFHPNGKQIAACGSNPISRIWDLKTHQSQLLSGHRSEVNALKFSSDGKLIATVSDDSTVRIWDSKTAKPFWHAPVLLHDPPRIFSHQGWTSLEKSNALVKKEWTLAIENKAQFASENHFTNTLCIKTFDDQLEIWDTNEDKKLFAKKLFNLWQVRSIGKNCIVLANGNAIIVDRFGKISNLISKSASAIEANNNQILVATTNSLSVFDSFGMLKKVIPTDLGVTTMTSHKDLLAVGYKDGNIELLNFDDLQKSKLHVFEEVPSVPVERILFGPQNTLIAGFANGIIGMWSMDTGARLDFQQIHGPVVHLLLKNEKIFAATELGQYLIWDISFFYTDYCTLLRQVWKQVPVIWEMGNPVLRSPPTNHKCYSPMKKL